MHLCSTVIFQNGRYQKLSSCRTVRNFISILFVLFLFFSNKKKLIFFILFTFFFSFVVFKDSGFKRTLCGSTWETLKGQWSTSDKLGSSKARYGCCSANKYMSSPIYYFQDYSNKYFDRCENGNYNTQVACETSGEWWFEGVDSKCVYCAAGTWTGGYCQESTGSTGPAIYMTGTSCLYLYDVIFFTLNHTYTRINIPFFFIHSFIFFRWS